MPDARYETLIHVVVDVLYASICIITEVKLLVKGIFVRNVQIPISLGQIGNNLQNKLASADYFGNFFTVLVKNSNRLDFVLIPINLTLLICIVPQR